MNDETLLQSKTAHIKSLHLLNFKKFKEVSVRFTPGVNVLVGANNAGKSTVIEALDIVLGERNLSASSIKRNLFNNFIGGENNISRIVLEIVYPNIGTTGKSEINFIKQLKEGKGSSRSFLPAMEMTEIEEFTVLKILKGTYSLSGEFVNNKSKSGYKISNIFLVAEISMNSEYVANIEYSIYVNSINNSEKHCFILLGISGSQRSTLFNYLLLPANRINNIPLFEISDYNWLGRYVRELNRDKMMVINDFIEKHLLPIDFDEEVKNIIKKFYSNNVDLNLDLLNKEDLDSIIANSKIYVSDNYCDEVVHKAQGMQSAVAVALFAGYIDLHSKRMPKNQYVGSHWGTVLIIEEPESHFHYPLRNKLMKIIKSNFLDKGAQVFLSTHDDTFIKWNYTSNTNLVFPGAIKNNNIVNLNLVEVTNENERRFIRFNSKAFFTDRVLVVEGSEEVCIDLMIQQLTEISLMELGITIISAVGGIRSNPDEQAHNKPRGGKDNIPRHIEFLNKIKIDSIVLVDIDVIFENGNTIKNIVKAKEGNYNILNGIKFNDFTNLSEGSINDLVTWWEIYKNNTDLKLLISILSSIGIFVYPGDFESLFTKSYLKLFENDKGEIIKEKHAYDVKNRIEEGESIMGHLTREGVQFINNLIPKIESYIESFQSKDDIENNEEIEIIHKDKELGADLPF